MEHKKDPIIDPFRSAFKTTAVTAGRCTREVG